jgi:hypothetical protein
MKRSLSIVVVALLAALLLGSAAAWAKRKPSTPEDRAQAVKFAHELEANPLSEDAVSKRKWLIEWYEKVPDITVVVCDLLGPLPENDHPLMPLVLSQMLFSNGAFQIEHPDSAGDQVAVQTAGVEGALKVYEVLVKAIPQGRLPFLDELLKKQSQGQLLEYVKGEVAAACGN